MNGLIKFLKGTDKAVTGAFDVLFRLVWLVIVISGAAATWIALGWLDYSTLMRVLGTLAGGVISGLVAWLAFKLLALTGGL